MKKLIKTLFCIALPFLVLPYIMSACKKDPCSGIICQNGGTCVDGSCSCANGFSGSNCETQLVPTAVVIKSVSIIWYTDSKSNNQPWDIGSEPDLFISIETGQGSVLWTQGSHYTDYKFNQLPLKQTLATPLVIKKYGDPVFIRLYDYDSPTSFELVGGLGTTLYTKPNPFTKTIKIGAIGSSLSNLVLELEVDYQF